MKPLEKNLMKFPWAMSCQVSGQHLELHPRPGATTLLASFFLLGACARKPPSALTDQFSFGALSHAEGGWKITSHRLLGVHPPVTKGLGDEVHLDSACPAEHVDSPPLSSK